jgi:hypothetical protein
MIIRSVLAMGMLMMTGCLFTVDSDRNISSARWSDHELESIVRGQTSATWVRDSFGEPSRSTEFEDGSMLWRYNNRSQVETEVGLFLLFHIDVEKQIEQQLNIEIKNGIVSDYWVEESRY